MENKINIAELLKDCPKDMELDCTMYEDVYFNYVDELNIIHCYIQHKTCRSSITFNRHGTPNMDIKSKCVIFPKGKTTWEGFVPPFEFKDGDVVATNSGMWIGITTGGKSGELMPTHCVIKGDGTFAAYLDVKQTWCFSRFATEQEKEKLFKAIKEHGYRWNFQAKRLEELITPTFKKGDKVRVKKGVSEPRIIDDVCDTFYTLVPIGTINFTEQDRWELVPNKFDLNTLKPFDKVLVRQNVTGKWGIDFFGSYGEGYYYATGGCAYKYCIPYKGNEHLLNKRYDCSTFYKTWE